MSQVVRKLQSALYMHVCMYDVYLRKQKQYYNILFWKSLTIFYYSQTDLIDVLDHNASSIFVQ